MDPDPYQNVTNPEHWLKHTNSLLFLDGFERGGLFGGVRLLREPDEAELPRVQLGEDLQLVRAYHNVVLHGEFLTSRVIS
jgi:hypothetical protein